MRSQVGLALNAADVEPDEARASRAALVTEQFRMFSDGIGPKARNVWNRITKTPSSRATVVGRTEMRIERDDARIVWTEVANLFAAVGWGVRNPDDVRAAFTRSTFKAFAFDAGELVGVGRTIDDGRFYATIVDVVVSPAFQRKGVGRAIVEDIQNRLNGFVGVTLTAAPDVQPFYKKLGWRSLSTGMIRPRSKEQARLNCPEDTE